jgi:hypothetical protein
LWGKYAGGGRGVYYATFYLVFLASDILLDSLSSNVCHFSYREPTGAVDLWSDMYYRAKKVVSTQYEVSRLYRPDDRSRKLYLDLVDSFGLEIPIPLQEVRSLITSGKNEGDFEEALDTLKRYGLLIKPGHDSIKILDNRPVKV